MKKPLACYWCGEPSTSKEHVPPASLFPKGKKAQLITVPACEAHNQSFGKLDERMKFYLQAGSGSQEAFDAFDGTTLRSLERPEASKFVGSLFEGMKPVLLPGGVSGELRINPEEFQKFFEKVIRGLYFHLRATPFGGECFSVFRQSFIATETAQEFFASVTPHFRNTTLARDGVVHNPSIFRFKYIEQQSEAGHVFCAAMQFYNDAEVISVLRKPSH